MRLTQNYMTITKYTLKDIGCYVDGCNGIYVGNKIQHIALSHGWKGEPALDVYRDYENYDEATEEAIDFMNKSFGVDGAFWGWNDGDFGLYLIDEELF